jgi:DNA (cytosine-5)-methyltransferase 1
MHCTKWHGFRQVGNSVPPILARSVASKIMEALGAPLIKPANKLKLGDDKLIYFNAAQAREHFSKKS